MALHDLDRYAHDAVLRDGRTIHVRPIAASDLDAMMTMWERLSPETIRMRFFAPRSMSREQMRHFTEVDYDERFAVVAERAGRIVGVSRFDRYEEDPATAEFAALVEDAEQGRGIGTVLLRALMQPAQDLGVENFVGDVLRENRKMLGVLRDAGFEPAFSDYGSAVQMTFRSTPTEAFLAAADEQDRQSAVAALQAVFKPASIAVVGASRDRHSVGGVVFHHLLIGGFQGPVYPVNRTADHVQSVTAYDSLTACPSVPELVVVCVPESEVFDVVTEAGQLGSRAAVILTTGLSRPGGDGERRQDQLKERAGSFGMRIVGPDSCGVLNSRSDVRMNASASTAFPAPGVVGLSSQSGALGLSILGWVDRMGLGLSSFASIGSKADISGNDLLQYWESDDDTTLILLYLESFGNPTKFGRIARRVGRSKPIVAVKSGGADSRLSSRQSPGELVSESDVAVDALFQQAGIIRTETLEELFGVADVLARQPLPHGHQVAILSNGLGPGKLSADACVAHDLIVAELAPATLAALDELLPAAHAADNPVNATGAVNAKTYGEALRVLARDPHVDAVLAVFVPPSVTSMQEVATELAAVSAEIDGRLPILSVFMTQAGGPWDLREVGLTVFQFPENAARALGRVVGYAGWRNRPLGNVVNVTETDPEAARTTVDEALRAEAQVWLSARQTQNLLTAFGIGTARARIVATPDEAAAAQEELGCRVAVKSAAPVHKSDLGGVRLGIVTPEETARALGEIEGELEVSGRADLIAHGFLVQEMITSGVEMMVGAAHDPIFGPLIIVGMGGTLAELMRDVSVRLHPITDIDVDEMLTSLRAYPVLNGYRGSDPVDVDALKRLLFRVSQMVETVPEIAELDLNPVFVRRDGVRTVDARVKLVRR